MTNFHNEEGDDHVENHVAAASVVSRADFGKILGNVVKIFHVFASQLSDFSSLPDADRTKLIGKHVL